MEKRFWERWSAILLTVCLGALIFYCVFRYAFLILLPFLLAWILSLPLRPLSQKMARKCRLPQPLCAALLLALTVGLGAWGIGAAVVRLLTEFGSLVNRLLSDGGLSEALEAVILRMEALAESWGIGFSGGEVRQRLYEMAAGLLRSFLSSLAAGLPELLGRVLASLPSVLFVILLTLIAGYYFCVDWERVQGVLFSLLPKCLRERMKGAKSNGRTLLLRYIKAYLWLLLITFALLFAGLLILRVDYAFLLALLIAVLDLLPVLGVGTVLLPWGLVMLLMRRFYVGFGLILLYLIIVLIRQVLEPRLIGKSLGLHPLVMLFASYAGFCLFGVLGMILGPVVAIPVKYLFEKMAKKKERGEA